MILFFRGKAATGKSMAAMAIAEAHTFKVIHKDTVFDELLEKDMIGALQHRWLMIA